MIEVSAMDFVYCLQENIKISPMKMMNRRVIQLPLTDRAFCCGGIRWMSRPEPLLIKLLMLMFTTVVYLSSVWPNCCLLTIYCWWFALRPAIAENPMLYAAIVTLQIKQFPSQRRNGQLAWYYLGAVEYQNTCMTFSTQTFHPSIPDDRFLIRLFL